MSKAARFFYITFVLIALLCIFAFGLLWFQFNNIPHNFGGWLHIIDVILFLLLTYVLWHPIVMRVFSWAVAYNIKDTRQQTPQDDLKVAFITTFVPGTESKSLLHKTLPAIVKVYYKHDTWLLDEGNDPEVARICRQFGVKHFSRKDKPGYTANEGKYTKTKGGNHNSWYDHHGKNYDIVAQIDTDFIPKKTFLVKTLGYFRDEKIAFVGTPQIYGNVNESFVAKAAAEQTYSFYGPLLRGFSGMKMNMLIGANHVIRVKALESVDHYSAHITEDLLTGMKLHSGDWKSAYVHEPLAIGEGPTTWQSYFDQQMRWAYGCMDILFRHSLRLMKTMGMRQALYYLVLQQHYFMGLTMVISTALLCFYFIFGLVGARVDSMKFILLYLIVIASGGVMNLWLQRFNARPKYESGLLIAGRAASIAAWPVFFLAFLGAAMRKRLSYKVTPKGHESKPYEAPLRLFIPHIIVGGLDLGLIVVSFITKHNSIVMLFWAVCSMILMFSIPFALPVTYASLKIYNYIKNVSLRLNKQYNLFEFKSHDAGLLPEAPTKREKYSYVKSNHVFLLVVSVISSVFIGLSMYGFIHLNTSLWFLFPYFILTILYSLTSLIVNATLSSFDLSKHKKLVKKWRPREKPSVDIFLPNAGEPIAILRNTWDGVRLAADTYGGVTKVYALDDVGRDEVRSLAAEYGFIYGSRPNKGEFKKAGNLRYGFKYSKGQFIAIFDADFRPRKDFLQEMLPYFYQDVKLGIMQSPQYFEINERQNWLERGAGAVQEMFYRFCQVTRRNHNASICVGSNAVYRRAALDEIGGTSLIEHSEDVHTGFDLMREGWRVGYIPVVLAKGLCPSSMESFFKQQYRWCLGSMTLLGSEKFWTTRLGFRARLSFISGFLHYIFTAFSVFIFPIIPLVLIFFIPDQIRWQNYFLIIPSIVFTQLIFPLWHKSTYGIEAWAVRMVYSWAHLFALFDAITRKHMQWQPTGTKLKSRDNKYLLFRVLQVLFNFLPAMAWVVGSILLMLKDVLLYFPLFASGVYFLMTVAKTTFYFERTIDIKASALLLFQKTR